MPAYHPLAEQELLGILKVGGRSVKRCLGMMLQRHLRMDNGAEPLSKAEDIGSGNGLSVLYQVVYSYSVFASVDCVYQKVGGAVTLLAADAQQGVLRLGLPASAPDARARAVNRSS